MRTEKFSGTIEVDADSDTAEILHEAFHSGKRLSIMHGKHNVGEMGLHSFNLDTFSNGERTVRCEFRELPKRRFKAELKNKKYKCVDIPSMYKCDSAFTWWIPEDVRDLIEYIEKQNLGYEFVQFVTGPGNVGYPDFIILRKEKQDEQKQSKMSNS